MAISQHQKRLADIAEAQGYLPVLRSVLSSMSAPFWWHGVDESGNYRIIQNGTVCFIDTGSQIVAVTAAHVIERYIEQKRQSPDITCQLGNIRYNPENHVISINAALDLATFYVPSVVVAGAGCTPSKPPVWPPQSVQLGDTLLCGGYPGAIRQEHAATADLPFQWFVSAASPGTDKVVLCLDIEGCYVPLSQAPLANRELGGMSGGPIFKYVPGSPIERIELAGFIYEFQPAFGLMFARPAHYIEASGKICDAAA